MGASLAGVEEKEKVCVGEETVMSNATQSVVCQRCGRGFVVTTTYRDFLARRGIQVIVPVNCMTCFMREGPLPKQESEVLWFNPRKHYGFIDGQAGQDIFLHGDQILEGKGNNPHEGQVVRFHVGNSPKGPKALNVELL
jgi:CspA family cold shock protein